MTEEAILTLLASRLEIARTVADTTMLWWVSSIVFCGSILVGVWLEQERLLKKLSAGKLRWLGRTATFLLAMFFAYPIWICYAMGRFKGEAAALLSRLGDPTLAMPFDFSAIQVAVGIGLVTFLPGFVLWLVLWRHLPGCSAGE